MTVSKELRTHGMLASRVVGLPAAGIRLLLGGVLCIATVFTIPPPTRVGVATLVYVAAWLLSVGLTDKYINKYAQRYVWYLAASHLKAAVTMAFLLFAADLAGGAWIDVDAPVWRAFGLFTAAEALVSLVWRTGPSGRGRRYDDPPEVPAVAEEQSTRPSFPLDGLVENWTPSASPRVAAFAAAHVPVDAITSSGGASPAILSRVRLNDVRRLTRFLLACADRVAPGGYLIAEYVPLESVRHGLFQFAWHRAFPKIPYLNRLYFAMTGGKNRALSKTEVWGRLWRCGFEVVAETAGGEGARFLVARKTGAPSASTKASYYPLIALDRVALDGRLIRAHKLRTMYPFSEFLQKKVFEDNALGTTGKFAGDFRITEYGHFLRKYWLDELPQLFDWWRGDIKLVGLRAMSRHYFSLYPAWFKSMYVQVKPGLIPPLFGESSGGFEGIVEVERLYLERYLANPLRTDVQYLFETFRDIVFRGVRSR